MSSLSYTDFLRSLIHILEAKKMNFPRFVYCLMIIIMYCQLAGYVFCTYESKPLLDPKIVFFAHWNEYSTGTFLLFVTSNDTLTLLVFWFFEAMLYCYIIYIIVLTLLDHYKPNFTTEYKDFFDYLNTFYQFFFSSFLWIFYVPFTEIHSGILVCGNNSFLVEYRTQPCSIKPIYFFALGGLGLLLTFLTGVVLVYFYINYEFMEKNYLKRRFQPNQLLQLLARTLLIFLYYLDISNIFVVKHIVSHILGLTSTYDFLMHLPFRDQIICRFYGCVTLVYEYSMILFSIWELSTIFAEFNIFFMWILGNSFIIAFVFIYVNNHYNKALYLLPGALNDSNINNVDVLLEKLMELALNSESDKTEKLRLQGVIERMHKQTGKKYNFFERKHELKQILAENQQINNVKIVRIINELFIMFFKDPFIIKSKTLYEFISLKYCSFLGAYQENPIKAYYELKLLLSVNCDTTSGANNGKYKPSVIFLIISKVITQNIQKLLTDTFKIKYEMEITVNSSKSAEKSLEMTWKTLPKSEEYKIKYVKEMTEIVKNKLKFWEALCMGYNKMDDFLKESLSLMKKIQDFNEDFYKNLNASNLPDISSNVIYLKLMSLYYLMILNDNLKAKSYESKLKEIKKIDSGLKEGNVNSISILSGQSIVLQISLLREKGRIVNQKTEKMARFFGYSFRDFQSTYTINSLMPEAFGKIHALFLNRFIKKGPSGHFLKGKTVYGLDNQGFIFPMKLNLNLTFVAEEDFVLSGVLTRDLDSSFTFIFNELGDILGVSNSLLNEITNGLQKKEIRQIYENYKIFWFMPELLEQLPSAETIKKFIEKSDNVLEVIINGRLSIYFPKSFQIILEVAKKYKIKHEVLFKNLKKYEDLFTKETKIMLKKFCYLGNNKQNLSKQLARYSLRHEIYFISKKKYISTYILTIHELYQTDNIHDMDFLSYSIEKTNTTQTSQYTYLTMQSNKEDLKPSLGRDGNITKNIILDNLNNINTANEPNDQSLKNIENNGGQIKVEPSQTTNINDNNLINIDNEQKEKKKTLTDNEIKEEEKSEKQEIISEDAGADEESNSKDHNDRREASLKSTHSTTLNNKGLTFISTFLRNSEITVLLKKIFLIITLQILIFFLIDIIYIILIKSKFNEYNVGLKKTLQPSLLLNFYCKTLLSANTYVLYTNGLVNYSQIESSIPLLYDNILNSYEGVQQQFPDNALSFYSDSLYLDQISIRFLDNGINNASSLQKITFVTFSQKIQSLVFSLSLNNYDTLSYLQLRVNFLAFYKEISYIFGNLLDQLNQSKDSFTAFYIYLTVSGLTSAFLLQIISFPFYRKYYKYLEKILILITRIQEKECDLELYKFKHFLHYLESSDEIYMLMGLSKLEGEKVVSQAYEKKAIKIKSEDYNNYHQRAKLAKKSNYLTSRINSHQLNMYSFKLILFLSLVMVSGYYGGAFLFLIQINNYLDYSNQIMTFTNTIYFNLNILNVGRQLLLSYDYLKDKDFLNEEDLKNLRQEFNSSFHQLQNEINIQIEITNGQVPQEYLLNVKNLLNENSCDFMINTTECQTLILNTFEFGLRQYTSYFINKIQLIRDNLLSPTNMTLEVVKDLIITDTTLHESIEYYRIMENTLNNLQTESVNTTETLLNALYNKLFIYFVVGGILCSCAWLILAFIRMNMMWKEIKLSKKLLIMIPISKLNDETTLHLMKNLDNI